MGEASAAARVGGSGRAAVLASCAIASGVLLLHAHSYGAFLADDALISLRYAKRLVAGEGLTWTPGERVEGYSNLLWVLACAGLAALGAEPIRAARLLGALCALATLVAATRAAAPRTLRDLPWALPAPLALALSGSLAAWTVGGLETPLVAALLALALIAAYPLLGSDGPRRRRPLLVSGALLALLCWTRPDAPLLAAGAALGLVAARGPSRASLLLALRLARLPALAVAAQLAFRRLYYDAWLPNPALAKLGSSPERALEGLVYLSSGLGSHAGLVAPALLLATWAARAPDSLRRLRLLGVPLLLWCVYLVPIGGDVLPAHRLLAPVVVIFALVLAEGLRSARVRPGAARAAAALALAGSLLLALTQARDEQNQRARRTTWTGESRALGALLRRGFAAEQPLLAVDSAGSLPYFSELPALDMLGLTDRFLAEHPPADVDRRWPGHGLGDGAYVLSREPDLVVFCRPRGRPTPCFRSGTELRRLPAFAERYRLVQVEAGEPPRSRAWLWARAEGGRIGIRREPGRVAVPAWLLASTRHSAARLGPGDRLEVELERGRPALLRGLRLAPGVWTATARVRGPAPRLGVAPAGTRRYVRGAGTLRFALAAGGHAIDVVVRAPGNARRSTLLALLFSRASAAPPGAASEDEPAPSRIHTLR